MSWKLPAGDCPGQADVFGGGVQLQPVRRLQGPALLHVPGQNQRHAGGRPASPLLPPNRRLRP
eukprot:scaffold229228_cov25-Prasinocladus_malaysianus.AAC.1